MNLTNS